MREGIVLGSVTSTVKHPCLNGNKLLVIQVLNSKGEPDGNPEIIPDTLGAGKGDKVVISWDGIYMTEVHNDPQIPARAWILGIIDNVSGL